MATTCPDGHIVAFTVRSSQWGGPLAANDRALTTFYPCRCELLEDPPNWPAVPPRRDA